MNVNKSAKPINSRIFVKSDKLTDEAIGACKVLHIDQSLLIPRPKESFKESGVANSISEIRFYHYEEKRKSLINEVEEYLKGSGLRNTTTSFIRNEFKRAKNSIAGSPCFSNGKPDIPLRQPLEEESLCKRKAAKDIFEREKWEKVIQNKISKQLEEETQLEKKKKAMEKRITTVEKKIRHDYEEAVKKARKWNIKLERAKEKEEVGRKEYEKEVEKKFKDKEKKRSATLQK